MVLTKGEGFVRKLGRQNFRVYALLGRALANLTISAEAPLVPTTYDSHVRESQQEGAPIAWNAPGPVPVTDTDVALPLHAPHPYAAMLFVDFLMSKEGQALYRKIGYVPAREGMAPPEEAHLQKLYLANRPNYVQEFEQWSQLTQQVFMKTDAGR
jgi:iron(III) transport system substrate-binding protein